jgi:hypothetical protein
MAYTREKFLSAFDAKTRVEGDCLIWVGKTKVTNGEARGLVWCGEEGRWRYVHQVALERKLGRTIIKPKQANHTCDHTLCVLEDHLYEGTQQQNVDDMFSRGRGRKARGSENGKAKLTEEKVVSIKQWLARGETQIATAIEHAISKQTISEIARGNIWTHVII